MKLLRRELHREQLLRQSLDSSLLRQKELTQQVAQAQHRLQEMAESQAFRTAGQLPSSISLPTRHLPPELESSTPPI